MKIRTACRYCSSVLLALLCAPVYAGVSISSFTPSLASPQVLGTSITWTVTATDSASGPVTFQFNVTPPGGSLTMIKDFNVGTLSAGTWTAQPFLWVPTSVEGTYSIEVVAKDFNSKSSTSQSASYTFSPLATGSTPVVAATANPLVALFSAPSCASGSKMRVSFRKASGGPPPVTTDWANCAPPATMNFEIAGMYPSTAYNMFAQTITNGRTTNGPSVSFTTGALPTSFKFPTFKVGTPGTDKTNRMLLVDSTQLGGQPNYPKVAVDLTGKVMWYYWGNGNNTLFTRPLLNGTFLSIESGTTWGTATNSQLLRQLDFEGNIVKETNTGVLGQELLALGAVDGGPCTQFSSPAPVGSGCIDGFTHDAISFSIGGNQFTGALLDTERIFPVGTQGDTSGLPVDVKGNMVVIMDSNWQAVWYWDSFDPAGGGIGYPLLPVTNKAVLNETCGKNTQGCGSVQLLGTGIAPQAKDWLHMNTLYYWRTDTSGGASGDLILSSRNQDAAIKIDYNNGGGKGDVLWVMGPCGTFTFNNIYSDPWPWFSGQHDVGIENGGAGPMTTFDDGNTRTSRPGLSTSCIQGTGSGNSRGMALTIDEATMQVTPVLSADLGVFAGAEGSAQLLANGDYFFLPGVVFFNLQTDVSYLIEVQPTAGTDTGTQILNIRGPESYRAWQMTSLYAPPIT